MKINSVNLQSFGKLYGTQEQKNEAFLYSNYSYLKEYKDMEKSETKHIYIDEDNDVFVVNKEVGANIPIRIGRHRDSLGEKVTAALVWLYPERIEPDPPKKSFYPYHVK